MPYSLLSSNSITFPEMTWKWQKTLVIDVISKSESHTSQSLYVTTILDLDISETSFPTSEVVHNLKESCCWIPSYITTLVMKYISWWYASYHWENVSSSHTFTGLFFLWYQITYIRLFLAGYQGERCILSDLILDLVKNHLWAAYTHILFLL